MFNRIWRAFRLDRTLFRMVADSAEYTNEAIIIAVVVSLLTSFSAFFGGKTPMLSFIVRLVSELLFGWVLWALVAYFVGSTFFKGRSSPVEMMRTLSYAGVWRVLGLIPCIGWIAALIGGAWAGVIAIRESMEFDTTSAVVTALVGLLLYIIASAVLAMVLFPVSGIFNR